MKVIKHMILYLEMIEGKSECEDCYKKGRLVAGNLSK